MKHIILFIMLVLSVLNLEASSWKQTAQEIEILSSENDRAFKASEYLFKTCKPNRLGTYVIARVIDTVNPELLPCDLILRIETTIESKAVNFDFPEASGVRELGNHLKNIDEVKAKILLLRDGAEKEMSATFKKGKLGILILDRNEEKLIPALASVNPEPLQEICKRNYWASCFNGIPWGTSFPIVKALVLDIWHKGQSFKFSESKENQKDDSLPKQIDPKFYSKIYFYPSGVDGVIEEVSKYQFGFLAIGENRLALVNGEEKVITASKIDSENFKKSFNEKHKKALKRECGYFSCTAWYNSNFITSRFSGNVIFNNVVSTDKEIMNAYFSFKKRFENMAERERLLQDLKRKDGLEKSL